MFVGVYFIVCTIILQLLPVLSLTAFWVLTDFCHKVALSCLIDTGVILKPQDCMQLSYMYAFDIDNHGQNISQAVTLIITN